MPANPYPAIPSQDLSNIQIFILGLLIEGAKSTGRLRDLLADRWESASGLSSLTVYLKRFEDQGSIFSTEFDEGDRIYQITRRGYQKWAEQFEFAESVIECWKERKESTSAEQFPEILPPTEPMNVPVIERMPTPEEQQKIIASATPEFRQIYEFSVLAKVRAPDLVNAKIECISDDELILEEQSATGRKIENRRVELNDELREILTRCIGERERGGIFKKKNGKNWEPSTLSAAFRKARTDAGVSEEAVLSGRGGKIGRFMEEGEE